MKILYVFLFLILLNSCKKNQSIFKIETQTVNKNIVDQLKQLTFPNSPGLLYSDEKYEVWKSCSGEWGGTVYFKNKQTGKIRYAIATCPVSINKINGKYYVSNSLSHMMGNSNILEISDPENMKLTNKIPIDHPDIITREYEAQSHQGTKKIIDSNQAIIKTSFVYNGKLYSILSNIQGTAATVSELKNNRFQTVATFPEKLFYSDPIIIKGAGNYQKLYFQRPTPLTLEINRNNLKLTFYKK